MVIEITGTAIPTHYFRCLDHGVIIMEPICRCYVAEVGTSGNIYCPAHGEMHKSPNGEVKPVTWDKVWKLN